MSEDIHADDCPFKGITACIDCHCGLPNKNKFDILPKCGSSENFFGAKDAGPFEAWWNDYHGDGDVCTADIEDAFNAGRRHQREVDAALAESIEKDEKLFVPLISTAIHEQEIE